MVTVVSNVAGGADAPRFAQTEGVQDSGFADALGAAASASTGTVVKSTGTAWRPPWMTGADTASQYLLPSSTPDDQLGAGKPSLAQFMSATGADVPQAVEALYGSVGANKDYRDWTKIMAAGDPLLAARQASQALYNSTGLDYAPASARQTDPTNTIAKAGNFAYLEQDGQKSLFIVDGQGRLLRGVNMDPSSILRASESFGLDLAPLNDLADQLDAAGVAYQPGKMHAGSNAGVDLRDLASGGLGAAYDWRADTNVGKKGAFARADQAQDVALATRLGLTQNLMVTPPDLTPSPTPTPSDPGAPTEAWSAPWMEGLDQAAQYLLPADTPTDALAAERPSLASFMADTGAGQAESVEAIYGAVGSNLDYRDWDKIMAADDPLTAARQATNALYNSDLSYAPADTHYPDPADVIANSGNFAWLNVDGQQGLHIIDSKGALLRGVGMDAPSILRAAESFGLDLTQLNGLADQLDAAGIAYQPGKLYANSNAGVNLRDLAAGGLGSAYDWRQDTNASKKGAGAVASVNADNAMASRLGLTPNLMVTSPPLTQTASLQAAQAAASFNALLRLSQEVGDQDAAA